MTVDEVRKLGGVFSRGDVLQGSFGKYLVDEDLCVTALNRDCWGELEVVTMQRPCTFNVVNGEVFTWACNG